MWSCKSVSVRWEASLSTETYSLARENLYFIKSPRQSRNVGRVVYAIRGGTWGEDKQTCRRTKKGSPTKEKAPEKRSRRGSPKGTPSQEVQQQPSPSPGSAEDRTYFFPSKWGAREELLEPGKSHRLSTREDVPLEEEDGHGQPHSLSIPWGSSPCWDTGTSPGQHRYTEATPDSQASAPHGAALAQWTEGRTPGTGDERVLPPICFVQN